MSQKVPKNKFRECAHRLSLICVRTTIFIWGLDTSVTSHDVETPLTI